MSSSPRDRPDATGRREFLAAVAGAGASIGIGRRATPAPQVVAETTVFFQHPGGERTLVRFTIYGVDDRAGRIRLYDARRRLMGTAGVIRRDNQMAGELWVPLERETRVFSELETPTLRTPVRTPHVLTPKRRWTLHWATVADPVSLVQRLNRLPPLNLAAELAILHSIGVTGNPYTGAGRQPDLLDHLDFLRSASASLELEIRYGIPGSSIAVADAALLRLAAAPLALRGAGIRFAILVDDADTTPFHVLESHDGSRVIAASPITGSDPRSLGFALDASEMMRRVEAWLTTSAALLSTEYRPGAVLLVSGDVSSDHPRMAQAADTWNTRFAFPRIVRGGANELFNEVERANASFVTNRSVPITTARPSPSEIETARRHRHDDLQTRVNDILDPIARLLAAPTKDLAGLAQMMQFPVPGTVIVNSAPITRTDVARMSNGRERLITDVPALGYVYVPDAALDDPEPYVDAGDATIMGQRLQLRLDPQTGAISSLYDRTEAQEWVRATGRGLNAIRGASLQDVQRIRLPGVGTRLTAQRFVGDTRLTTEMTLYDELSWLDVVNRYERDGTSVEYEFEFSTDARSVAWETPAGFERVTEPPGVVTHLRWLELRDEDDRRVIMRALDAPYVSVEGSYTTTEVSEPALSMHHIRSHSPGGMSRFRVAGVQPFANEDEAWYLGWGAEPLHTIPVTGQGAVVFPRFGRLLRTDVGILVVGIKPAERDDGLVIYLQDIIGLTRETRIIPGLLGFRAAGVVDLVERDVDRRLAVDELGTSVTVPSFGVVAVHLSDLYLDGA